VATAIFRFNRSNSLQAIWPVAGQIVTAYRVRDRVKNRDRVRVKVRINVRVSLAFNKYSFVRV